VRLLGELDPQMIHPEVGVRVYWDNLQARYGAKCATLVATSAADYVSFVDDDDAVAPDYVDRIVRALDSEPDYVGFPVNFTVDGKPGQPVELSLRHTGWADSAAVLTRDYVHKNPIRRELALQGVWGDHLIADKEWADSLREAIRMSGRLLREEWIPDPMYHYRLDTTDSITVDRVPVPEDQQRPLPAYTWLTWL